MACKDCIHYDVCQYHIDEETKMTVNECGNFISTADVVEVVRCKDCKYADPYERHGRQTVYYCLYQTDKIHDVSLDRVFIPVREADDYCSCGKRRDT